MERKNQGKPPTSSRPPNVPKAAPVVSHQDLSFAGIGLGNKENQNQPRALGSGLKQLLQAKNQSAAAFSSSKNRNHSVGPPVNQSSSNTNSLQNNGKRIVGSASGNNSLVRQNSSRAAVKNHSATRQTPAEEEKKQGFQQKPSDRFMKIKTADPFGGGAKKHKTNFGYVYSAGGVPCRINHGTVNHKIQWDKHPQELDYDPLLVNCFEGLLETDHPYSFVANKALVELLEAPGAPDKTIPILQKLIMPLRAAFLSPDMNIWTRALDSLKLLSETVGHNLTQHIHIILAQLNKKMTLNKNVREKVMNVLNTIEERGGKDALEVIRQKIPTYTSIYM